jgi:phage head maturation protease
MAELLTLEHFLSGFGSLSDDEFIELVDSGAFDEFLKACRLETLWPHDPATRSGVNKTLLKTSS